MDFPCVSVAIFYNVGRIISSYTEANLFRYERSGYHINKFEIQDKTVSLLSKSTQNIFKIRGYLNK